MRVCVLGGGIIGVATAYFLTKDGHDVTLLERGAAPAMETSFANGGQISVGHTDPWASPSNLRKVLGWLGKANAPLSFKLSLDPALWRWVGWYLRNCSEERARINTERMLRIAAYSHRVLQGLKSEIDASFDARQTGILQIFRDARAYEVALEQAEYVTALGWSRIPISKSRAVEIEPALATRAADLAGVIYAEADESGDAHMFAGALAAAARQAGADLRFNTLVTGLVGERDRVRGVSFKGGQIATDAVVVAMGSYSPLLLRELGLKLPVYPAKGYSVTLPVGPSHTAPTTALIDDENKLVYSRLGDRLRVAGLAETIGYDTEINLDRAGLVLRGALDLFPNGGDANAVRFWTGLRPQTPDSVPVLGATPIKGLYLNTGHGTLGWTMAAGSARIVADAVSGRLPEIDLGGLTLDRFL